METRQLETRQPSPVRAFIRRHAALTFYVLVFIFMWGPVLVLVGIAGTDFLDTGAGVTSAADISPALYASTFYGPLSITLAAIVATALGSGRTGLHELRTRVTRWRLHVRWYAAALLTLPILWAAILAALSLTSKAYLPDVVTADDGATLLVTGLVAGLVTGLVASVFEEIGWTGLATHELGQRHGLLATGLLVGVPWCLVHLPLFVQADTGSVPPALSVAAIFFWALAYRTLMVWAYRRTRSVPMVMLLHLPADICPFVLSSSATVGLPDLVFNLVLGATLWVLVAVAAVATRKMPSRPESYPALPRPQASGTL